MSHDYYIIYIKNNKIFWKIIYNKTILARLPIKKIYVDSKYKTKDSISNANFKIVLPQTIFMPENIAFYIDEIAIPHSWYTVEDFKSKLYLSISNRNCK